MSGERGVITAARVVDGDVAKIANVTQENKGRGRAKANSSVTDYRSIDEDRVGASIQKTLKPMADNVHYNCCLMDKGKRCMRPATADVYSKQLQRIVMDHRMKLSISAAANHIYICDFHRVAVEREGKEAAARASTSGDIGAPGCQRKRRREVSSAEDTGEADAPPSKLHVKPENAESMQSREQGRGENKRQLNDALEQLSVAALKRLKKGFGIQSKCNSKRHFVEQISNHLRMISVNEKETIAYFIFCVKTQKNKVDEQTPKRSGTRSQLQAAN